MAGLIGVFCFPLLGSLLHLSAHRMGLWAGCSLQAVPQVIAAGYAYSHAAGIQATLIKLVRVVFLAPTMILLRLLYHRKSASSGQSKKPSISTYLPPFILLFFLMIMLNTLGVFKNYHLFGWAIHTSSILNHCAKIFLITGIAAVGLKSALRGLGRSALSVFMLAFLSAIILACFSLGLSYLV